MSIYFLIIAMTIESWWSGNERERIKGRESKVGEKERENKGGWEREGNSTKGIVRERERKRVMVLDRTVLVPPCELLQQFWFQPVCCASQTYWALKKEEGFYSILITVQIRSVSESTNTYLLKPMTTHMMLVDNSSGKIYVSIWYRIERGYMVS